MRHILIFPALAVLLLFSACTIQPMDDPVETAAEDADDIAQAKSDLAMTLNAIDSFAQQTQQGRNLSDMTLGLFVSGLLGQLGGLDVPLSEHLHKDGRFIEGYLSEVFQYHPDREIAFIRAMSMPGRPLARQTAAAALDCLQYIPDSKASAEAQAKDRETLAQALVTLRLQLSALVASLP